MSTPQHPHHRFWTWFALLLVLLATTISPAAQAHADEDDPVQVTISSVTPTILTEAGDLTITGTIHNTSRSALSSVRVTMWGAYSSIASLDALHEIVASDPDDIRGTRVSDSRATDPLETIGGMLQPGQSVDFQVTAATSGSGSLRLESINRAHLVGVQVLARQSSSTLRMVGQARTLVPYQDSSERIATGTVVVLNSAPALLQDAVGGANPAKAQFSDDHLAGELTGRLNALLTLAERSDVNLVIDPGLYDAIDQMTDEYQVIAGDTPQTGSGTAAAQDFMARLTALVSRSTTYRGLYNSPNVSAAAIAGENAVLTQPLPEDHPLAGLPLAVDATGGTFDQTVADFLTPLDPDLVLADTVSNTVQRTSGLNLVVRAVSPDTLSGPAPAPNTTNAQRLGRYYSEQLLGTVTDNPLVLLVDDQADVDWDTRDVQQRDRVTIAALATEDRPEASEFAGQGGPQPSDAIVTRSKQLTDFFALWGDLSDQSDSAFVAHGRAQSATWSSTFASDAAALDWVDEFMKPYEGQLHEGALTLRVASEWHLSSDTNQVPVQVTNTYGVTVRVRVVTSSENSARINIPPSEYAEINPNDTATIRVEPNVLGNGSVSMSAWLETSSGTRVGDTVDFQVSANSAGRIVWVIIVASGIAFLAITAMRVKQVRKSRLPARPTAAQAAEARISNPKTTATQAECDNSADPATPGGDSAQTASNPTPGPDRAGGAIPPERPLDPPALPPTEQQPTPEDGTGG